MINHIYRVNEKYLHDIIKEQNYKVVALGGGTGLSTMIRGLKKIFNPLTAVVTVSDDGGSSGFLRQDLGILPPGDIRNCILALARTEPIMEQLLQYRFEEGLLKGHSFGNLFLAAMNGISTSFEEAVRRVSDVLAVKGKVLPVTEDNISLCALLNNGNIICGETNITNTVKQSDAYIKNISLIPEDVTPLPEVINEIENSDVIILGPGSLYTSIIPNLLIKGVSEAILKSKALKIYICNIMTQPGETLGYSVYDHVKAIENIGGEGIIDYCIANIEKVPEEILVKYKDDRANEVKVDKRNFKNSKVKLILSELVNVDSDVIRHNTDKLSLVISYLVNQYNNSKAIANLK